MRNLTHHVFFRLPPSLSVTRGGHRRGLMRAAAMAAAPAALIVAGTTSSPRHCSASWRGRLLPRIRRRALRRFRAAALRAARQDGRARPGDHQAGELEDPDALKRRIEQAAKFVPLDQLCLSQCGFSSTVEGNVLSYEQ